MSTEDTEQQYWYFEDNTGSATSYCKLVAEAVPNVSTNSGAGGFSGVTNARYRCKGFDRYVAMLYPETRELEEDYVEKTPDGDVTKTRIVKKTIYGDTIQWWINAHEAKVLELGGDIGAREGEMSEEQYALKEISDSLNIVSYFSDEPALFKELSCYWIEGTYDDENIAVLETTTPAEEVDLSQQLLKAGQILRCGYDQNIADPGVHQNRDGIVDHGLVIDGKQLLGCDHGQRI
jgi:hypothetical protein